VHAANAGALEFNRRLGAVGAEVRIMGVDGERLRALGRGGRRPSSLLSPALLVY
jgi:hypothetical protein